MKNGRCTEGAVKLCKDCEHSKLWPVFLASDEHRHCYHPSLGISSVDGRVAHEFCSITRRQCRGEWYEPRKPIWLRFAKAITG